MPSSNHKPDVGVEAAEKILADAVAELGSGITADQLADRHSLSREKLEATFELHFHASVSKVLVRARMAEARRLLASEAAPSEREIARAIGLEGVRELRRAFLAANALEPRAYRDLERADSFELRLPPSFRHEDVLAYIGRDPDSPTEKVDGRRIRASLRLTGGDGESFPGLLEIELRARTARCRSITRFGATSAPSLRAAHAYAVRRLGLGGDPSTFERQALASPAFAPLIEARPGLTVLATGTPFDCLVWAVVGQQVNLAFAYRLRRRLIELAEEPLGQGFWPPPTPESVARLELSALTERQFSQRKAEYVVGIAREIARGGLSLEALAAGSAVRARDALTAVRGIGPWSAAYVMMRGLRFSDCVPVGDAGLVRALAETLALPARPGVEETLSLMAPFAPFRSLATYHLWKSLSP